MKMKIKVFFIISNLKDTTRPFSLRWYMRQKSLYLFQLTNQLGFILNCRNFLHKKLLLTPEKNWRRRNQGAIMLCSKPFYCFSFLFQWCSFFSQSQWCVCVTHVYHYSWDSHSTGQRRKKHRRVREQPRAPASPKRTDDVVDISSSEEDRAVGGGDLGEVAAAAAHWARVREDEGIVVYDEGRIQKKTSFIGIMFYACWRWVPLCWLLCVSCYVWHCTYAMKLFENISYKWYARLYMQICV